MRIVAKLLQRPTEVSALRRNSPKLYDGNCAGTGMAPNVCSTRSLGLYKAHGAGPLIG